MTADDKINIAIGVAIAVICALLFSDLDKRAEDARDAQRWREAVKPFIANGVHIP